MTDQSFLPEQERELVVVYPDRDAAVAARQRLVDLGVGEHDIDVDQESDEVASLRAEMRQELTDAWIVPSAAFIATKESMKGMLAIGTGAAIIGALLGIPFAFIDFGGSFWFRVFLFMLLGALAGATVGFVAGAGVSAKRPGELMAAHRGTVLRVHQDTAEIRSALVSAGDPLRMDEVDAESVPVETLLTEEQTDDRTAVDEVASNLEAGDDYHPADSERRANG